jgi:hypothetical protein
MGCIPKTERHPWQSTTVFEPSGNSGNGKIPKKKPTVGNDDGLRVRSIVGATGRLLNFL